MPLPRAAPAHRQLLAYPQGNNRSDQLSLYLAVAEDEQQAFGLQRTAQFKLSLLSQSGQPGSDVVKDTQHTFTTRETDWGEGRGGGGGAGGDSGACGAVRAASAAVMVLCASARLLGVRAAGAAMAAMRAAFGLHVMPPAGCRRSTCDGRAPNMPPPCPPNALHRTLPQASLRL